MVLERADHAKARGAKIYGRLAGIGMSNDAYHITAPEPDGEGSARAIAKALKSADLTAADIGHVNAHATSTPIGDIAESNTILRAVGDHPVVTATKSMTGHMLGAAGAVESIATVLADQARDRPRHPQSEQTRPGDQDRRRGRQPRGHPDGRAERLVRVRRPQRRAGVHRARNRRPPEPVRLVPVASTSRLAPAARLHLVGIRRGSSAADSANFRRQVG